jgi:hypothetical protein
MHRCRRSDHDKISLAQDNTLHVGACTIVTSPATCQDVLGLYAAVKEDLGACSKGEDTSTSNDEDIVSLAKMRWVRVDVDSRRKGVDTESKLRRRWSRP